MPIIGILIHILVLVLVFVCVLLLVRWLKPPEPWDKVILLLVGLIFILIIVSDFGIFGGPFLPYRSIR